MTGPCESEEMDDHQVPLPVTSAQLTRDPELADAVRRIGGSHGVDYFDDRAVRRMLREQEAAVRRGARGARRLLGAPAFLVGSIWPALVAVGMWPQPLGTPKDYAVVLVAPAVLLVLGLALLVSAHREGVRRLRSPELVGYRQVLAASRAHGAEVAYVPSWLVGRGEYGGRESTPIPAYAGPPATSPQEGHGRPAASPRKPAAVVEYERIADHGGWHGEAGMVLIIAGGLGPAYGYFNHEPAACATIVLAACGLWIWLVGARLGRRKEDLREQAREYIRQQAAAQAAGAPVPELSPALRALAEATEH